jgi:hypothetical protein
MPKASPTKRPKPRLRFEAVKIDPLFEVLDAVAWLDSPSSKDIAQFAGVDPRTAGKLLKNARLIGLVESADDTAYVLAQPYPYKGTLDQKRKVVREALLRLPLIASVRQFMALGNDLQTAMRKAATIAGEQNYDKSAVSPIITWANSEKVLDLGVRVEGLVDEAVAAKQTRHEAYSEQRVAFISHSSKDKKFVRQLAADLVANGVNVWLDEQRIRVGDSIPEKVAQGVAESDFFLLVISENSVGSAWVQKELNSALVKEIERRRVTVMPLKLDDAKVPDSIIDKKYADFSGSYASGLSELLNAIKSREVLVDGRK